VVHLLAAIFPEGWLSQPVLQPVLAIVLTLAVLYVTGRVTSQVIGPKPSGSLRRRWSGFRLLPKCIRRSGNCWTP